MIGLPVLVITALPVLIATFEVTPEEGLSRDMGTADARIRVPPYPGGRVLQDYLGRDAITTGDPSPQGAKPWTAEEVAGLLPPGSRVIPIRSGSRVYRGKWFDPTPVVEIDLRDPLTRGMYLLRQGRFPAAADEVVVSTWLARHGVGIRSAISLSGSSTISYRVVGVVDDAHSLGRGLVVAMPGTAGRQSEWLVDTPGPVLWNHVLRLNAQGLVIQSRAVISDPKHPQGTIMEMGMVISTDTERLAIAALVIMMIVLEVVLLAGPAFAVGIRRRRRELALVAAQGGARHHLGSMVLADALVLGGVAASCGAAGGLAGAWAAIPVVEHVNGSLAGPYEVPIGQVAGVVVLGIAGALLAAVVPARQAARTDVVGALAGLRGEARIRKGWPLAGLALLVSGFAVTIHAAVREPWFLLDGLGSLGLVGGSFCTMVALVLLTPWLVEVAAGLAARLPFPFRLAARDATRNRGRTAPAVAAVAAATVGLVAMMIVVATNQARQAVGYRPEQVYGTLSVDMVAPRPDQARRLRTGIERELPGVPLIEVARPSFQEDFGSGVGVRSLSCVPEQMCAKHRVVIGGRDLLRYLAGRDEPAAAAALAGGKAVVFHPGVVTGGKVALHLDGGDDDPAGRAVSVPAIEMTPVQPGLADVLVPVPPATNLGLKPRVEQFLVDPGRHVITRAEEKRVLRMLGDWGPNVSGHVERGYEGQMNVLVLGAAALLLVLGGTFAATGLAAVDAWPDVTTLAVIGAPPGTRRMVTMGQAWFIAATGVVLGAVVGFVPGITVAWSLRVYPLYPPTPEPGVVIPWADIIGLVVLLPLVAGLVAGVFARTRVTLTRRVT
ncbi:FtsX-like permease family protein [Sphaerisporangium sp. NBC_01403]|uniref:FtsX-like permease family protein n=1 Tax=Sphaerisporangium sp. NBC_01403 TaxID=2903599 RepID=UPI0038706BD0